MKHTKGPWLADGNGFSKSFNISSAEKSICDVAVSRADADLMAAAPEMLECLEDLRNWLLTEKCRDTTAGRAAEFYLETIDPLIKKARGES
jgi:hypothetical protein